MSKLETFLQRNDLDRSMRAQAMFRLAALHDDRVKDGSLHDLPPATNLYMQIIRDFPESDVAIPSHYLLAGDLTTLMRMKEAQHVYRVLVCHNHFSLAWSPDKAPTLLVPPMPQEHDRSYWHKWEIDHPVPLDKLPKKKREKAGEETVFVNPYPRDCQPLSRETTPEPAPLYIADAWSRIGEEHFSQIDTPSGPYELNLAAVAYQNAILLGEPPLRNLVIYKLAWTYFRQQRYAAAVAQFIEYLRYDEAHPDKTPGRLITKDLRWEAATYIAISLLFVDFDGPGPDDPFIPRDDVLDKEKDPRVAEKKLHIAIDRVKDPHIIPQNETWTSSIYMEVLRQFRDLLHYRNQIELGELFLSKWPEDSRGEEIRQMLALARTRLGKP
ncbi:MAG TPA: hypothetical protein PK156_29930, partial [Polyangium sp.]|nr:hypothetical protein [Polyangium sp.]